MRGPWSALVLFACATSHPHDDLSVAQHRELAARERVAAEEAYARWLPSSRTPRPGPPPGSTDAPRVSPIDLYPYNPSDRALDEADRHLRHAREHEAAAAALETSEAAECRTLPQKTRAACPLLGPIASIRDRTDGVEITFGADAPVAAIVAHMRCHLAFARAHGFTDAADCPLYLPYVSIDRSIDGRGVYVTAGDARVANEIQRRSRLPATTASTSQ